MSNSRTNSGEDFSPASSRASSRAPSRRASRAPSRKNSEKPSGGKRLSNASAAVGATPSGSGSGKLPVRSYRVSVIGAADVGKSSLTSQFLSSQHMNTYDTVEDDVQKVVSLSVDGRESRLVFIDHKFNEMSVENQIATYDPDGFLVVFAVDDEASLRQAEIILSYLKSEDILRNQAVILVANKTDLVRSREVSSNAGKSIAIKYGCKYIETSPGINHNIDELLVGILAQIQLWEEHNNGLEGSDGPQDSKGPKDGGHGGFKVMDLLEKVLKINNNKSKSCGNLHVL